MLYSVWRKSRSLSTATQHKAARRLDLREISIQRSLDRMFGGLESSGEEHFGSSTRVTLRGSDDDFPIFLGLADTEWQVLFNKPGFFFGALIHS